MLSDEDYRKSKFIKQFEMSIIPIKHNSKSLFPQYGNYSHAIEIPTGARFLFVSGLNGYRRDGMTLPVSFEEQARMIWSYIKEILSSASMTYDNIISLRTYLVDPEYDAENMRLRKEYLGDNEPTLTVVCCQLLES